VNDLPRAGSSSAGGDPGSIAGRRPGAAPGHGDRPATGALAADRGRPGSQGGGAGRDRAGGAQGGDLDPEMPPGRVVVPAAARALALLGAAYHPPPRSPSLL